MNQEVSVISVAISIISIIMPPARAQPLIDDRANDDPPDPEDGEQIHPAVAPERLPEAFPGLGLEKCELAFKPAA
jgi:hypothetical protein